MSITSTLIVQMIVFLILVGFTMNARFASDCECFDERASKIADGLAADKANERTFRQPACGS